MGAITDTIVAAFELHDLVALTLSADYQAPSAAILVTSLAHAEKERDKAKEADISKICTSNSYVDMVLDVKLKRAKLPSAADADTDDHQAVKGEKDTKAASYRCRTVQRRGVGEVTVLPLSEEDLLFAEYISSAKTGSADGIAAAASTTPPPAPPSASFSPKSFGRISLRSAPAAPTPGPAPAGATSTAAANTVAIHNSLAVTIVDKQDPSEILGTHTLSCSELTKAPSTAEARANKSLSNGRSSGTALTVEVPQDAHNKSTSSMDGGGAGKSGTKSPSSSMFSSFYRSKPVDASAGATHGHDAVPNFTSAGVKPRGKPDLSPHPTGLIPLVAPVAKSAAAPSEVTVIPKVIKFHDPLFCDVELARRATLKAARLVIKRANDLPSSSASLEAKKIPPTVYATVYLVDAKGEKRSINNADSRTEAIKSYDPEWNKEVLLQNEKQGVDDITAVMVLFRDSSVGMMKHHHIGRVTIPFSCFLDNMQADFCLPLEPTYRLVLSIFVLEQFTVKLYMYF